MRTEHQMENNNMIFNQYNDSNKKNTMTSNTKETTFKSNYNKDKFIENNNIIEYIKNNSKSILSEDFEMQEYIGKGASGAVFKGIHKKNKKQVAIKFFINEKQKEKRQEKDNLKNTQEISLSRKLHNKNIIELYAYLKKENIDYSILEYGKYGDMKYFLKNLLKRKTLSETALNYFVKQILEGLCYIHRCKIVHMDIKPDNILINGNLEAKITDFSISCSYSSLHPENLVKFPSVGTPKFMSPEVMNKTHMKLKEAEKIDIYSLGVTIYYLFYGKYPYQLSEVKGEDYENIAEHIKTEELNFPKGINISEKGKDFLKGMLEKDYNKRMNIRQALNHPWIKGSQIIFEEKENLNCLENFLIKIVTDNISEFNNYLK